MARPSSVSATTAKLMAIKPEDYAHSPVHYAAVLGDHASLNRLLSSLPKLGDPEQIRTESNSVSQERVADQISAVLDCCDVPSRETPLYLAVKLDDLVAARAISSAEGDISLQNAAECNPLQEAFCRRNSEIMKVLLRHHHWRLDGSEIGDSFPVTVVEKLMRLALDCVQDDPVNRPEMGRVDGISPSPSLLDDEGI